MTDRNQDRYVSARSHSGDGWVVEDLLADEIVARFPRRDDPGEAVRLAMQLGGELDEKGTGR